MSRPDGLSRALTELHEDVIVRQAEFIRDWPEGPERLEQAKIHVRAALLESLQRISQQTLYRVYSILGFVMPRDAPITGEPTPDEVLDQQAEWELAYQEQLRRQTCEECGDGLCPTEPTRSGEGGLHGRRG